MHNLDNDKTGKGGLRLEEGRRSRHVSGSPKRTEAVPKENREYKRYNLILPAEVYADIKAIAEKRHTTVLEILRKFIKLGFIVDAAEDFPGAEIIVREEGSADKKLILI